MSVKSLSASVALFVLVSSSCTSTSIAQERSDSFFGKDFAASPLSGVKVNEDTPEPKPTRTAPSREPRASHNASRFSVNPLNREAINEPSNRNSAATTARIVEDTQPKKKLQPDSIMTLSVIVNSLDKKHLSETLRELLSVSRKDKLPIGSVMHIGDYRAVDPATVEEIRKYGGSVTAIVEPPSEFPVQTSPSWILTTPSGKIVLEGVRSVGLYISPDNRFVEKPLVADRAPEVDMRGGF